MKNKLSEDIEFNTGWKTKIYFNYFNRVTEIVLKLASYDEVEGITKEQEISYVFFKSNEIEITRKIEETLKKFDNKACTRFSPRTLLFERNGMYVLLLDDEEFPDDGIVVCMDTEFKVMTQDEYL